MVTFPLVMGKVVIVEFDEFLAAELPGLSKYSAVLTGDRQAAHDLLTDTLVVLALRWSRIGSLDHPRAYVRRALTNAYLSGQRRARRRRTDMVDDQAIFDRPGPDSTAVVGDRDAMRQLLSTLPPAQRAAVVMRYYLDLSDVEIAASLGCATGTVRSHLSRALATLRISVTSGSKE